MATELQARPASRTETHLHQNFAAVATRIQRVDVAAQFLLLALAILLYALGVAVFDAFVGARAAASIDTIRWTGYGVFLIVAVCLGAVSVRSLFRRVNPYYVAQQLEAATPDAKNSLINWLDLHEQELPSAFQKNLGNRAAERWDEGDADQIVVKTKLWVVGAFVGIVIACLLVAFVLDPVGFLASMRRAFFPFYAPAPMSRTHLTLVEPKGDIEIHPAQAVNVIARIAGRVPASGRPDAPKLQYRYHVDEDYAHVPLTQAESGLWTALLQPAQIRSGVSYKLSAGDAETPEHQIRVRARAHVSKVEVRYTHRPYRKLTNSAEVFPNAGAARPYVRGPRGSNVEMLVHTSRPVKSARVEWVGDEAGKELPVELTKDQAHQFVCRFVLDRSGQFRIAFTAADDEENTDRELSNVDVIDDAAPSVVLTRPGKDIELPFNSSFILEGKATSAFGIRGFTLQFRDPKNANAAFAPLVYRPGTSFQSDDGGYPPELQYMEFVALDKLQPAGATLAPGGVLEYWLQAADGADYPNPAGNVGKSGVYKLKLLPAPVDPKQEQVHRKNAQAKVSQHQKKQDAPPKKNEQKKSGDKSGGGPSPQDALNQLQKEIADTQKKLENAPPEPQPDRGETKGAEPQGAGAKDGQGGADAPEPQAKDQPPMEPGDAGDAKGQGGSGAGQSRDQGGKNKNNDGAPGDAKGVEEQGPGQATPKTNGPPELQPKAGTAKDPGAAKSEPKDGAGGQARGDDGKMNPRQPSGNDVARKIDQLLDNGPDAEAAARALAEIAKNADDARKREIAAEALVMSGRDPGTGKKAPNPFGSGGKSTGISDELKATAAKREFSARIAQMQLDDWKKRLTPERLSKAGVSEEEWQRYLRNTRAYDALVRTLNAKIARQALQKTAGSATPGARVNVVESSGASNEARGAFAPPPPELREPQREFSRPRNP